MSYVTLDKKDPKIKSYLWGTFSKTEVALPIKATHLEVNVQEVTFQIVPVGEIKRPPLFLVLLRAVRAKLWLLSLLPILFCFSYGYMRKIPMDYELGIYAILSVFCLHCASFLLNDFFDHFSGGDLLGLSTGTQVIQRGWLRAKTLLWASIGFILVAIIFAFPIYMYKSIWILVGSIGLAAAILGYSFFGKGLKNWGLGELIVVLCFGPLLTTGFYYVLTDILSVQVALIGLIYGLNASFYLSLRNFKNIMADSQVKAGTLMSRMGFDGAKSYLYSFMVFQTLVAMGSYFLVAGPAAKGVPLAIFTLLMHLIVIVFLSLKIKKINSPLASEMATLPRWALFLLILNFALSLFTIFVQNGYKFLLSFDQKIWVLMMLNKIGVGL